MTQEEKAKAYDEALEKAKEMMDNCSFETTKVVCQELFPELVESEDERIRRTLLEYFGPDVQLDFVRGVAIKKIRDWLEKQKERGPLTKEEEYTLHRIIEYLEDETCPPEWISLLHDIYCLPYEKQKEHQNNSDAPKKTLGRALTSPLDKDKNLDEIAQDYVDGVKEYNPELTWDLIQTAMCYGYHYREWIEHKPAEYLDTDNMKPRVKISGRSYGEWEPGDTGVVDGYCRGANDIPYAIVILDRNFRFVMVDIEHLELIG